MTSEERGSSASYTKSENVTIQEDQPSDCLDEEHVQLALHPKLQLYFAQESQKSGCWGRFFPIPFERATRKSWWDPTFDSEILEEQYRKSSNPYHSCKFRYAVLYMLLLSISWFTFFLLSGLMSETTTWPMLCGIIGINILCLIFIFIVTYTKFYNNHMLAISLSTALILCLTSLTFVVLIPMQFKPYEFKSLISPLGHFSTCIQTLLIIYTLIPLKLYMSLSVAILYSSSFELLTLLKQNSPFTVYIVVIRLLLHISIHLIGLHILVMTNVRMRNTFMKVGQSLLVKRQLESEKKLKENMIHSLMPPKVANWLLSDDENFKQRQSDAENGDIRSLFRPFNMNRMENVSILFADIVGFTKMSSNKSAEELVDILNNLFQRFDLLCQLHNCEKISTLGDCYYCVSGCPDPQPDHAKCCVEMGLSMIQAIKMFVQEQKGDINMRVGVHTGTVLCGIVGTRRFKFDVWSNDVTLANRMESTGKPGMVHISEKTNAFLNDHYTLEEGEAVFGLKTYFILGRREERTPSYSGSLRAEGRQRYTNSLQLFISPPAASPSLSPLTRPRVLSCDTTSNYIKPIYNPQLLSPDVCKIKASSLPSILDSENEQECDSLKENSNCDAVKTPTSTASSGKYSVKIKSWKIPRFLRKGDQVKPDPDSDISANCEDSLTSSGYQQVPILIESLNSTSNGKKSWVSISETEEAKRSSVVLDETKDSIDIKSYISQSRSDIEPYDYQGGDLSGFIRAGSYRSHYGRKPSEFINLHRSGSSRSRRGRSPIDIIPCERTRSATVAVPAFIEPKLSLEVPGKISLIDDQLSTAHSAGSRKDSGIKSNSRRSSIQQIDNPLLQSDIMQHRVSGYYTSSQSSINVAPYLDKIGSTIQNLRKQSDRQLIRCVQDNSKSRGSYFTQPPLSQLTLFFKDEEMERDYRANVHSLPEHSGAMVTLANSRFNTYLDVFVSSLAFCIISASLFLLNGPTETLQISFVCLLCIQCCGLLLCIRKVIEFGERYFSCVSRFYRWNMCGAVLVSLPLLLVLINFSSDIFTFLETSNYLYTYVLFVGIVHFCNFTQLNCWMKNVLATCYGIVFTVLFLSGCCSDDNQFYSSINKTGTHIPRDLIHTPVSYIFNDIYKENLTENENVSNATLINYIGHNINLYYSEIIMDLILLLVLVWLLNREFEIAYRLSFHSNYVASRDEVHVHRLKKQADYLIYNIVPEHVADQLKKNAKYSENFKNVAIIFASIVNFNEMYDESYLGGKEFLRVLNELIGDFDELLDRPEFRSVEKIKTIGSTFMAASGLNSQMRLQQEDPNEHLFALMDFALEMQNVINDFNRDLLEFNLVLRVGYCYGEVTAAVIGNTKLYYDIWGDAVNVASRMDSTGVNGRIQVGENCLEILEERYVFEPRGSVFVKGKDHMNVYLLHHKK